MPGREAPSSGIQTSILRFFSAATPGTGRSSISSSPIKVSPAVSLVDKEEESEDAPVCRPGQTAAGKRALKGNGGSRADNPIAVSGRDSLIKSMSAEDRRRLALELDELPTDWVEALLGAILSPTFAQLKAFLADEAARGRSVFPPQRLIYTWAKLCPLSTVKVVIIGQDPYHNDGQAMGLAFSVPPSVGIPQSLRNIYAELSQDVPSFKAPTHGDLTRWAQQGVLLLNTCLTVHAHEAASHAGHGWEQFTDAAITAVSRLREHAVFVLWGAHAQRKSVLIDTTKHLILKSVHPSPLSASRGFFGCKHFSKTNAFLATHQLGQIDWNL